ncbi:unnamed protein product (macronuclear) [Paramecium tetraurelia]|uniref:Cyclic nucleotide-binding domain-containing protein n=1 Tax=Paramecium tetraurelia TaxID=5888 RepID=A0BSM9_PARTE|nr:uncharacterized protein GSPATT00031778001 [Paramecium tetraurelia]CAK61546.1 unnamed protein product [Paramecium tetraurelia]|eukprot:XP_001428944.1 hypothetical protein (macronuclear) [Paramecium tetraurelia strain d4-2]
MESFIRKFIYNYYQTNQLADQLARDCQYEKIKQDDQIILQEGIYFVVDGQYQLAKRFIKLPNFLVIPLHEKAIVFALSDVHLLSIRTNFSSYLSQLKELRTDIIIEFLRKTLFPNFPRNSVARISKYFCLTTLPFNHVIYKENEDSRFVYLIREGEIKLQKEKKQLKLLVENQIFGEYEVFFNRARFAKAVTNSSVSLLTIKSEIFLTLLKEYPILKQRLLCQSVLRYEFMYQPKSIENQQDNRQNNSLLRRQKKTLRSLSPQQDCIQMFEMSQQIQKERVRTGYKVMPLFFNYRVSLVEKCATTVQSPQSSTRRKLETTNSEVQFRSQSPVSNQKVSKIISSKHNMFRQQPSREFLLQNFVNQSKPQF